VAPDAPDSDALSAFFERLYADAGREASRVPWARLAPQPDIARWIDGHRSEPGRALAVGSGLGDEAAMLAARGWETTAFDVSPSAISWARERHEDVTVDWRVVDLFNAPTAWRSAFDLVVENRTLQSLPPERHREACRTIGSWVAPGGRLLVVTHLRAESSPPGDGPPWPLSPAELELFLDAGLTVEHAEDRSSTPEARVVFAVFARSSEPVVVTRAETPFEADAVVALLRAHGIAADAQHRPFEDVFPTLFSKGGTPIWVPAADAEEARALLEARP